MQSFYDHVSQTIFQEDSSTVEKTISAVDRKPLAGFLANVPGDRRQLVELLYQDIVRPSDVSWDDVKGLAGAKSLLMESVVYPVK